MGSLLSCGMVDISPCIQHVEAAEVTQQIFGWRSATEAAGGAGGCCGDGCRCGPRRGAEGPAPEYARGAASRRLLRHRAGGA